ncbi:sterol desaturase family protein [Archangium sp.]|uniref:sterol desaturase family protein n=1 Tax=Archangium sp. TaxID=1872627 RepID=UPI00286A63BE|nr:sterol desaturase family protein [Archangium sp.]
MSTLIPQYLAATAAFFLLGLLFSLAERRWPLRPMNRRRELGLNVLGFLWSWHLSNAVILLGQSALEGWAPRPELDGVPGALRGVAFFLAADFFKYAVHVLMHTRWLWPVHRFHHSPEQLWWFAGNRASAAHVVLHFLPTVVLSWLLAVPPSWVMLNAGINLLWNHVMHANVAWPAALQRPLEWVLVTPRYHHVHHARAPELLGTNFASVLTLWDRLFGTSVSPERMAEGTPFGVDEPLPPLVHLMTGVTNTSPWSGHDNAPGQRPRGRR